MDFFPLTPLEKYLFLFLIHISSALPTLPRALRQISSPNSKKKNVKKYWYQKKKYLGDDLKMHGQRSS